MKAYLFAALAGTAIASVAQAQFNEAEGNDTRAAANLIGPMVGGSTLTGSSTSSSGAGVDYFRIQTGVAPLAIYRHTLSIQSPTTSSMTASIRGTGQTGAAANTWPAGGEGTASATESSIQTSRSLGGGLNESVWYGFGRADEIYYRVNGSSSTAGNYVATLSSSVITPVNIGQYQPGFISMNWLGQGHSTDTDMWVYDSNFNAITGYGNDDESVNGGSPGTGATLQSYLNRQYLPGIYYIAVSNYNLVNNQGSPSDDDYRTGSMASFGDMVLNSSTSTNLNMAFTITDSSGTGVQIATTKANAFDVNWLCFEVVPTPGSAMLLGMGGLVAIRRRR